MKKFFLIFLLFFFTLPVIAVQKLKVVLDWFPNPDHAPLIIAKAKGFFQAEGLDVALIAPADANDPPKWVAAGLADVGITYQPQYMEQVDHGLPLIAFGSLIDKPLNCLVTLKDSGINSIKDLKGKKIGSVSGDLSSTMLQIMLQKHGLKESDVQTVNVRYGLTPALLAQKVDAVTGMMRNFEVPQLEKLGHPALTFFPEDHGIPNYSELIFITKLKNKSDPRLAKFLQAIKQAIDYIDRHSEETWRIFAKLYPENNNDFNHAAWHATMPYFAEEPANFNGKEWQKFANFLFQHKLIQAKQHNNRYFIDVVPQKF